MSDLQVFEVPLSAPGYNGVSIMATAGATLSLANGKSVALNNSLTFSGTDGAALNIGSGGTLGTGAYATIANYAPLTGVGATGTWPISISGTAASATALAATRTIGTTGIVSTPASFNGTTNVTLGVTGVPTSLLTGTVGVTNGGTGLASLTAGNYLNAASASAIQQRTPAQVLSDIGALAASSYTASDVLAKLKTVDGSGSGLDADLLDGQTGAWYNQYVQSRGANLVTNGTGLMRNNYNFSGFVYTGADGYASTGAFIDSTYSSVKFTDELIPVDPSLTYQLSLFAKADPLVAGTATYFGIAAFDVDGNGMQAPQYMYSSPVTTLKVALNTGDTTITLTDATGWDTEQNGIYTLGIIVWNYVSATGFAYPPQTYSRHVWTNLWAGPSSVNVSTGVITLAAAWTGGTIPAGTPLSKSNAGGSYKYLAAAGQSLTASYVHYSGTIGGIDLSGQNVTTMFPPGTAAVRLLFLNNRNVTGQTTVMSNVSFTAINPATSLLTPVTIALSGAVTGTATSFNGSANITIPVTSISVATATGTLAATNGGTGLSSYTTGSYINAASGTSLQQRTPAQVLADIGALAASSYTASDILTKLKTVDGSGSGLDSDLLDGQQGSYYRAWSSFTGTPTTLAGYGITDALSITAAKASYVALAEGVSSDASVTAAHWDVTGIGQSANTTGSSNFPPSTNPVGATWSFVWGAGANNSSYPRSFDLWKGYGTQDTIYYRSYDPSAGTPNAWHGIWHDGNFNPTTYSAPTAAKWATPITLTLSGDVAGSASVDGSGNVSLAASFSKFAIRNMVSTDTYANLQISGIYRDTNEASDRPSSPTVASTSAYGQTLVLQGGGDTAAQMYFDYLTGNAWMRVGNPPPLNANGAWKPWGKIWTDSNDGAGSLLDADLLDGQQGSYYATNTLAMHLAGAETVTGQKTFQQANVFYNAGLGNAGGFWADEAAIWGSNSSSLTGALVVEIPTPASSAAIMFKAVLDGFDYSSTTCAYRYEVSGYFYSVGPSVLYYAYTSEGTYSIPMRAGVSPDGNWCLIFGADTTTWHYPKVRIKVMLGYNNATLAAVTGLTATLVSSTTSYTAVVTAPPKVAKPWAQISGTPTTLAGYGITDGVSQTAIALSTSGVDLNTITTPGIYHQAQNAGAAAGANYPATYAGLLEVMANAVSGAAFVYQRYTIYSSYGAGAGVVYERGYYSGTWAAWTQLARTQDNVATATKLATARKINGTPFDGTADITIGVNTALVNVTDSRSAYPMPYVAALSQSIGWDFKQSAVLNRTGATSTIPGTYAAIQTLTPWTDPSGGPVHELAYTYSPAGIFHRASLIKTSTMPSWVASTAETTSAQILPATPNGYYYQCTTAGTTGTTQPTWPTTSGATVTDGSVVWTAVWLWSDWNQLVETGCVLSNGTTLASWAGGATIGSGTTGATVTLASTSSTANLLTLETTGSVNVVTWLSNGTQQTSAEIQSTQATAFRFSSVGSYGVMWYQNSSALYLLSTASGDNLGAYTAARPFVYTPSTGSISTDATWTFVSTPVAPALYLGTSSSATPLLYTQANGTNSALSDVCFRAGNASSLAYYVFGGDGTMLVGQGGISARGTISANQDRNATLIGSSTWNGLVPYGYINTLTSTSTANPGYIGAGNGDSCGFTMNDMMIGSWYGIGFGPTISGQAVAIGTYSHYFNARTGDAGFQGSLSLAGISASGSITSTNTASFYGGRGSEGEVWLGNNDYYYFGNANNAGYYGVSEGYAWGWNFSSSTFTVYGTFNATSDARCKTDFEAMDARPLWRVLPHQKWRWKGSGHTGYGPTAQQVMEAAPEYVQENKTVSVEETNRSGTEAIEASKARIEAGEEQGMLSVDKVNLALEMAYAAGQRADEAFVMIEKLQKQVRSLQKELARERRRQRKKAAQATDPS